MSAALDELSGSETQIYNLESQKPDLRVVGEGRYFYPIDLAEEIEDCIGAAEGDERVDVVVNLATKPTPESVNFLEDIVSSEEPELLELAVIIAPEILRRGVESQDLESDDLDRVRNALARLMSHHNEDIKELAQEVFSKETSRLKERDTVSYQWLGWLGITKSQPPIRSYSVDILTRSRVLVA